MQPITVALSNSRMYQTETGSFCCCCWTSSKGLHAPCCCLEEAMLVICSQCCRCRPMSVIPAATGHNVSPHDPCYDSGPCQCSWSVLPPEAILMFMINIVIGGHVGVHSLCCRLRSCLCSWPILPPENIWMSVDHAAT